LSYQGKEEVGLGNREENIERDSEREIQTERKNGEREVGKERQIN
jgi:hypothetical protein